MPSTSLRASRLTTVAAASGATNWLNKATWKLFDGNTLSPLVQSGATSMGWLFDSTGTLKARPHNLLLWSEQFDNAAWTKNNAVVNQNVTVAPDGQTSADLLLENTALSGHLIAQTFAFAAGVQYTLGVYFREPTNNTGKRWLSAYFPSGAFGQNLALVVDAATGAITSQSAGLVSSVTAIGEGWYRLFITATATASASASPAIRLTNSSTSGLSSYQGDGTSGIFIWGAQLNQGELQPYYPTTGAAFFGPRVSYDPTNLSLGPFLLAEEARTNSIRNNTMQGAVAGTPGTRPTNWTFVAGSTGITSQVVGTGTEQGVPYIDIRYSGTATASASFSQRFEVSTAIAALNGQTWSMSSWVKVASGSQNGISFIGHQYVENNSAGSFVTSFGVAFSIGSSWNRYATSRTLTGTGTAFLSGGLYVTVTNDATIDITLRIGLPELSQGVIQPWSPPILTSGTAVTRSADNLSVTNLAATGFNASEGTLYIDYESQPRVNNGFTAALVDSADSVNNYVGFSYQTATVSTGVVYWRNGGNGLISPLPAPTTAHGQRVRYASTWLGRNLALKANNSDIVTATSTTDFPSVNQFNLARRSDNSFGTSNRIYQAAIIPQRVPDSGLQRLTRV